MLDLVFPCRCVNCGAEGQSLCVSCRSLLPRINQPFCCRCGLPLAEGLYCTTCPNNTMDIDSIRSVLVHEGLAREVIHWLKYKNLRELGRILAGIMAEYLASHPWAVDVLVAVPLHPRRIRQRGYNQSELLARELGRLMRLPISEGSLARLKNTVSQVSLGARERRQNLEGAFGCRDKAFLDQAVLVIDDVCTTGATLNACAAALKHAGAASVQGLTVSRER